MTEKKPNMTRTQFYLLCNEMHKRAEMLLREQPSLTAVAQQFSEWLKFKITNRTVTEAQEATGITWTVRKRCADKSEKLNRYRVLARAIIRLYRKLGEEVPSDLIAAYASLEGKSVEEVANYWKIALATPTSNHHHHPPKGPTCVTAKPTASAKETSGRRMASGSRKPPPATVACSWCSRTIPGSGFPSVPTRGIAGRAAQQNATPCPVLQQRQSVHFPRNPDFSCIRMDSWDWHTLRLKKG